MTEQTTWDEWARNETIEQLASYFNTHDQASLLISTLLLTLKTDTTPVDTPTLAKRLYLHAYDEKTWLTQLLQPLSKLISMPPENNPLGQLALDDQQLLQLLRCFFRFPIQDTHDNLHQLFRSIGNDLTHRAHNCSDSNQQETWYLYALAFLGIMPDESNSTLIDHTFTMLATHRQTSHNRTTTQDGECDILEAFNIIDTIQSRLIDEMHLEAERTAALISKLHFCRVLTLCDSLQTLRQQYQNLLMQQNPTHSPMQANQRTGLFHNTAAKREPESACERPLEKRNKATPPS